MAVRDAIEGLILVDKPEGPTSSDVVVQARRALGVRRIGHTGTLDPFASGLLLLCVGRATRLVEYFHMLTKRYRAVAVLGSRTDTDDREGSVVARSEAWRDVTRNRLSLAMEGLRGQRTQLPPDYSAKRVGGRRAYEWTRAGDRPLLERVAVQVRRLDVVDFRPPEVEFDCEVTTGTYIRALARDLGEELGCHAHLLALRRTAVGAFEVERALPAAQLSREIAESSAWLSPAEALAWLPTRELSSQEVIAVTQGRPVSRGSVECGAQDPVALLSAGRLVAVARGGEDGLRPEKVFPRQDGGA